MWRFILSRAFIINLIIAAILISALLWWIFRMLDDYTLHGQSITVPSLSGFSITEADSFLKEKELRYFVMDSVYNDRAEKGVIVDQDPKPDSKVKQNRTIYLVVNAVLPKRIGMPNLIDKSKRQAVELLETYGFKLGILEYVETFARDLVIAQKIKDEDIEPGVMIRKGTTVNLVLGNGLGDLTVMVPQLIGLKKDKAIEVLKSRSLNEGHLFYDESVITSFDLANSFVWKQEPAYGENMVELGDSVTLWLTLIEGKSVPDSVENKD